MRAFAILLLSVLAATVSAQSEPRVPTGSFRGRVINQLDSSSVAGADIRLYYMDSGVVVKTKSGADSIDVFLDSTRSRFGATDSTGGFFIRRIEPGRYMLQVRRIGFAPIEGAIVVDSVALQTTMRMQPTSQLLAKVRVVETSVDVVKQKLEQHGFISRSNMGIPGTFLTRADIMKRRPTMIADVLRAHGVWAGEVMLDRMPAQYEDLFQYPADLVLGIEVYPRSRPTEFNGTRGASSSAIPRASGAGLSPLSRPSGPPITMPNYPLIVIWTFIPGSP